MTFSQWDVLVVPFPFVESNKSKPRPIVVLTSEIFNKENGHFVGGMITTASKTKWRGDSEIENLDSAGLNHTSFIRMKFFTLDSRIGARKIGELSDSDRLSFETKFKEYIPL